MCKASRTLWFGFEHINVRSIWKLRDGAYLPLIMKPLISVRLRRETSEGLATAVITDSTQPSYATDLLANGQPAGEIFSTSTTIPTEVVPIEVMVSGTKKDDENPEVYLDKNETLEPKEGDTIETTTGTIITESLNCANTILHFPND